MGGSCSSDNGPMHVEEPQDSRQTGEIRNHSFRIAVIGDACSGKSAFCRRLTEDSFSEVYNATPEPIRFPKQKFTLDNTSIQLELIDVPGTTAVQDRKGLYVNIDAAIVAVDLTEAESIKSSSLWRRDVLAYSRTEKSVHSAIRTQDGVTPVNVRKESLANADLPVLLLGTKVDELGLSLKSKVEETLSKVAEKFGFIGSSVVSSKEGSTSVFFTVKSFVDQLVQLEEKRSSQVRRSDIMYRRKVSNSSSVGQESVLRRVGIQEIDCALIDCELPLAHVMELSQDLGSALQIFSVWCRNAGFVDDPSANVAQCVKAINDSLGDTSTLIAVPDGGFLQLLVKDPKDREPRNGDRTLFRQNTAFIIPPATKETLKLFHSLVVVSAKHCLTFGKALDLALIDADALLVSMSMKLYESAIMNQSSSAAVQAAKMTLDCNIVKVEQGHLLARQALQTVSQLYSQITGLLND